MMDHGLCYDYSIPFIVWIFGSYMVLVLGSDSLYPTWILVVGSDYLYPTWIRVVGSDSLYPTWILVVGSDSTSITCSLALVSAWRGSAVDWEGILTYK